MRVAAGRLLLHLHYVHRVPAALYLLRAVAGFLYQYGACSAEIGISQIGNLFMSFEKLVVEQIKFVEFGNSSLNRETDDNLARTYCQFGL